MLYFFTISSRFEVATTGTIKSIDNQTLLNSGLQMLFCNTYHLLLHPGPKIIEASGGLHQFINYPHPIITDSGGFQIFSLAHPEQTEELKGNHNKSFESSIV